MAEKLHNENFERPGVQPTPVLRFKTNETEAKAKERLGKKIGWNMNRSYHVVDGNAGKEFHAGDSSGCRVCVKRQNTASKPEDGKKEEQPATPKKRGRPKKKVD
jgi:hypothetical protein